MECKKRNEIWAWGVMNAATTEGHSVYMLKEVSALQQQAWDTFVATSPYGHFLQSWGWGELKASASWQPLRLALYDEQQAIVAVAQVLRRTVPHVPARIAHLAYIPRGPVLDWAQSELCTAFFSHLNNYLRHQGALALRFEPNLEAGETPLQVSMDTLRISSARPVQPLRTIMLDITLDETTLLVQMKEKWRYNLRLAERKGVTVRVATCADDVRAWYALMQTTSERNQFGVHTLD
ncbi:MAG: aminoacyltransferase, partial [Chloroflexota bacterium]|nr:aminoacyltransferase [Chloroflexota bacterium]